MHAYFLIVQLHCTIKLFICTIKKQSMQNPFSQLPIIEANWFDALEEAKDFIFNESEDKERISPDTIFVEYSGFNKFVETLAFINLHTFTKHEWIINVNNGIYEVEEIKKPVVLFYEYCKWGHLEKCKEILRKPHNPKFIASGFVTAINYDHLNIVKYLVENKLVTITDLYNSPLYECVFNVSIKCFQYLSDHFEPEENLLPYILEQNALKILKYCVENPSLKTKLCAVTEKDFTRLKNDMENIRYNNETMTFFKENFNNAVRLHY